MRRSRQAHDEPAGTQAPPSPYCVAGGCPLLGAISDGTKGGGPWFCRFHFGAEPRHWPAITEEVRELVRSGVIDRPPSPAVLAMREKLLSRGRVGTDQGGADE